MTRDANNLADTYAAVPASRRRVGPGPRVSVLMPTYNRPAYFARALESALNQTYRNIQVIAVNDGGKDVKPIIDGCNDPRVVFIDRKENRGKAYSLNEALERADGKYIAYLDDDDIYYPNHVQVLVDALESQPQFGAAYSDLYHARCRVRSDGQRVVLSKVVDVSRDFDRFVMLYFNHVLHVSLMHRRSLLEKTGPYNEQLGVLIDWDMTRRLCFFCDFKHVVQITGEYHCSVENSDRISVVRRRDKSAYMRDALTIRTTRPAKPWTKLEDMSIILVTNRLDGGTARTIGGIWRFTFYPYQLYLPATRTELGKLKTAMPNIVGVCVEPDARTAQRVDAALRKCPGPYVAIVPAGWQIGELWVEDALHALMHDPRPRRGYLLEQATEQNWAAVLKKVDLEYARNHFPNLPVRQSLAAAGVKLLRVRPEQILFQFDQLLEKARSAEKEGDYARAAQMYEYIGQHYDNKLWMDRLAANALFKAGGYARARELLARLNRDCPTVDTLLLQAKLHRREKDFPAAIESLKAAEQILERKEPVWA